MGRVITPLTRPISAALDQIDALNVEDLQIAWPHVPGRSTRGPPSTPLVMNGVPSCTGSRAVGFSGRSGELDGA